MTSVIGGTVASVIRDRVTSVIRDSVTSVTADCTASVIRLIGSLFPAPGLLLPVSVTSKTACQQTSLWNRSSPEFCLHCCADVALYS